MSKNPGVLVPPAVSAGDRLVMTLTVNKGKLSVKKPAGVPGWTQLGAVRAKSTLALAAYAGVDPNRTPTFRGANDLGKARPRTTPAVTATAGAFVLSYWADKSDTTTGWTSGVRATPRQHKCGTGPDHVCSLLADSGGPLANGPYAGIVARTNKASRLATMWTIVLRAAP
jgi:hypothetical protein